MHKSLARELVDKNGVDVDRLLDLMSRSAIDELANYYYYSILRVNLIGVEGEALKKIIEDARREDQNHFEALIPRIYELGGKLPTDLVEFNRKVDAALRELPTDLTDVRTILAVLLKATEQAVDRYTQICSLTCGKDNRTYNLALAVLHEEIQHQVWFLEFLARSPGEPERIDRRGHSPFVSKFLQCNGKLEARLA